MEIFFKKVGFFYHRDSEAQRRGWVGCSIKLNWSAWETSWFYELYGDRGTTKSTNSHERL